MQKADISVIKKAIADTIGGDPDAYTVIVTSYMQKLYMTARSICGNDIMSEDLVQETFIDGYLRLSTLRDPEKLEGWLVRILKNKAFNYITRTRFCESEELLDTIPYNDTPEDVYISKEFLSELERSLGALSPILRNTAVLYFWDELSMEDIALRMNVPLGTVKRRIHDVRAKLKKENNMSNVKKTLPDSFAEELAVKIRELEEYTKTYSTSSGFDAAYKFVKELIGNLSSSEDVKNYSVKSAEIAATADIGKYAEDSLAVYRKYGEVRKASYLLLSYYWDHVDDSQKLNYIRDTVIPTLEDYPDSDEKFASIGCHLFWMAYYTDKSTPDGIADARACLERAMDAYGKTSVVDASFANTVAALKGLDALEDDMAMRDVLVTGEAWMIEDGNILFHNQPGCSYASDGDLWKFMNYIFINAGCTGDKYFFPQNIPIEAGREEVMLDSDGNNVGIRRVVAVDETVKTPAGVFTDCLHLEKIDSDGDRFHMWYKNGVGLVKISEDSPIRDKVLATYEICGGEGYLPLAVGNKWVYDNPNSPDFMYERHEYAVERMGKHIDEGDAVCVSAFNYIALKNDWNTQNDPMTLMLEVGYLCELNKYAEAKEKLQNIVVLNHSRESVDTALAVLEFLNEKLPYDELKWRFCPSSANISRVTVKDGRVKYSEQYYESFSMGPWGTRHEENRIFGVKPFRYLHELCGTLWDERWVPGYSEEHRHSWNENAVVLTADNGGSVMTPAGEFADTLHLTVECKLNCGENYFYSNVGCGIKEYWFAKGVGVVRFKCTWGDNLTSDCFLTSYHTIAASDEMMPIHIGNSWRYEEKYLTEENYIARRDYKILNGHNGQYVMADHQMFTWCGNTDEYEAWKKTL